ncbi:MAG: Mov34/MPN/PAD-1 family protein [Candidatus Bathyarchaeota archaeon]
MRIRVPAEVLEGIMEVAVGAHPREMIMLLRGERVGGDVKVKETLFPPMGVGGRGFASFPVHMLPIDLSIVGTVHSHPSGNLSPSLGDFNGFYGRIMMIVGPPFNRSAVAVYDKRGERLEVEVVG